MTNDQFFTEISDDDLMLDRFEILCTDDGYMPYDHDCDDYLYDEHKNNCFDNYWLAAQLIQDAIITIQEHKD